MKLSKLLLLFVLLLSLFACQPGSEKRADDLFSEGYRISVKQTKVVNQYVPEFAQIFTEQNRAQFPANRDSLNSRVQKILPLMDESLRLANEAAEKFEAASRFMSTEEQRKGVALIAASHRKGIEIEQLFKEEALLASDLTITDAKAFNEKFLRLHELVLQKQKEKDEQFDEGKRLMLSNQNQNVTTNSPTPSQATGKQNEELPKQISQIASAAKGRVGYAAEVLETGEAFALNFHDHFPMQSVYKLPIGMAVLAQVDNGKLNLDQQVRVEKSDFVRSGQRSPIRDQNPNGVELSLKEVLRYAVSESDGTASDVLLRLVGVEAVSKYLNELGIDEIIVANSEKEIGRDWETQYRNWATPAGSIQLLRRLHERRGISETSQQLLYKFMIETPTFPTRLKGLLPKTAVVAHKTGSSGTSNGITAATNDIGIVTLPNGHHLAIAVYVSDSPVDLVTREKVIAQITKAIWDKVTRSANK